MASRMSDERLAQSIERTTKQLDQLDARKVKAQATLDTIDERKAEAERVLANHESDRKELQSRLDYLQTIKGNRPATENSTSAPAATEDAGEGEAAPPWTEEPAPANA